MFKLDTKDVVKKIVMYIMAVVILVSAVPVMSVKVKADEFETSIGSFPESYKPYLRALHQKYPNWVFKPYNTGLDFSTAVSNEASNDKSLVEKSYNDYLKSRAVGDYDASTKKYIAKDGSTWVSASKNTVAYFMDPRNFLNDTHIAMYEQLSYDKAAHTQEGVEAILSGSFMYNTNIAYLNSSGKYITTNEKYSARIINAAQTTNVSPYYLASKILQEGGKASSTTYAGMGAGSSINGQYSGYKGIYNFYNIGASDGTNAVANGLKWASTGTSYQRPWNTPAKSIVGGATYIGEKYINLGQDTTYFQRFNVVGNTSHPIYTHQYMTSIYGCASEAASTMTAYTSLGITGRSKTFIIPVYNNMPEETTVITLGSNSKSGVVNTNVNMRKGPNTSTEKITTLLAGEDVKLLECTMTDISYSVKWLNNPYWYRLQVVRDGVTYEGYVSANYIDVSSELNIIKGVPQQLKTSLSKTETVYYEVDDPSVATVDENGIVSGVANGTTTVRAYTQTGRVSVCGITVIEKGAVIAESKVVISKGEKRKLGVTVYPLDAPDKSVKWSSSNPDVAIVSADGIVEGKSYGTTVITAVAAVGGVEGKCTVTVAKPVTGIKLNKKKATVAVGSSITLKATITPSDATIQTVKWKSSDKKIAAVSKGVVTGVAVGNAKITVTTDDGSKKATCTVKVRPQKMSFTNATFRTYNSVKLTWNEAANVDGYKIYRKNAKGKYKLLKTLYGKQTSYIDRNLATGSIQSYKIRAFKAVEGVNRNGPQSKSIDVKVIPGRVVVTSATKSGKAAIRLRWKKVKGASGYAIYRKNTVTGKFKRIKLIKKGTNLTYKNKKLTVGTTYTYKVRAYRTVNGKRVFGMYSTEVTVTR